MKRVAEIIHIVPQEREAFLKGALELSEEEKNVLWLCGIRKQQYFALGELIFMTFEYEGSDFKADMAKMSAYLKDKGHLVEKRRRDVPENERDNTNWWAPVKKIGSILEEKPADNKKKVIQLDYVAMLEGYTSKFDGSCDTSYDEDDWTEGMHI